MILVSSALNSLIQLIGILVIFIFVLLITYFVTKWIGGYQKQQMSGRSFQVIDTVRIAGGKFVQILKIGEVYLVIAVGKDEVALLAKLTEGDIGLTEDEIRNSTQSDGVTLSSGVQESFQETLERIRERFTKKQG